MQDKREIAGMRRVHLVLLLIVASIAVTLCGDDRGPKDRSPIGMCKQQCWRKFLTCTRGCPIGTRPKKGNYDHGAKKAKCYKDLKKCDRACNKRYKATLE